jgi:DNA-binding CsgD family transcriptional regulator
MYNVTTHLSATEAAVLRGLAAGQRTAQIARATALNEATVFDLLDTLLARLHCPTRAALVAYARAWYANAA